jgi:hypothetical protein
VSSGSWSIQVDHAGGDDYWVGIGDRTRHTVTAPAAALRRLQPEGGSETPVQTVERVIRYLLDREPPESILSRFTLDDVARYFPAFWSEMAARR